METLLHEIMMAFALGLLGAVVFAAIGLVSGTAEGRKSAVSGESTGYPVNRAGQRSVEKECRPSCRARW